MRYSCQDIRLILESESEEAFSFESFEEHLAGCADCRALVEMDREIEGRLGVSLSKTAPPSLLREVMKSVRKENDVVPIGYRVERLLPVMVAGIFGAVVALGISRWTEIKSLLSSINIAVFKNIGRELISGLKPPEIKIGGLISDLANNPLILAGFFAATALVWALSLLELEKTPK